MQKYLVFLALGAVLAQGVTQYFQSDRLSLQSQRIDLLQERLGRGDTWQKEVTTALGLHTKHLEIQDHLLGVSADLHQRTREALDALKQQCRKQGL